MVFVQSKGNEMKLTDIKNSLNEISAIGGLKQVVRLVSLQEVWVL